MRFVSAWQVWRQSQALVPDRGATHPAVVIDYRVIQ